MLEFIVGLGFAVSIGAALAWVLLRLLRMRTTEVRGRRSRAELSDEELAGLLKSEDEAGPGEEQ
ncbi:MAG: hypothetical protein R6X12_10135 [bacterium]